MKDSRSMGVGRTRERPGAVLISTFLRLVGPQLCYLLAPFVTLLYFVTGRRERAAVTDFHRTVGGVGPAQALARAYLNFLQFAFSMVDRLFALRHGRLPPMRLGRPFDSRSLAQGGIFLGAHFGDWALCGQVFSTDVGGRLKVNVVMDLGANPAFAAQAGNLAAMGARVIDASRGTIGLLLDVKRALDEGEIVCFLADRGPQDGRLVQVPFFGRPAGWHLGPFEIAARFGKPLVGFFCIKKGWTPGAVHEVTLEELWNGRDLAEGTPSERPSPEMLLRRYVGALEKQVARAPTHWFNFFPFWTTLVGNGRNAP